MTLDFDDYDANAVLAALGSTVSARRRAEVDDLLLVAQWANLHGADPKRAPGGGRRWDCGGDELVEMGGDGTPWVQDLCVEEVAIARFCHHHAARAVIADILDLIHRLPRVWRVVEALGCEVWVARRVASLSRGLDQALVPIVDRAVAEAIGTLSPGRVFDIAAAKIIEADPQAHAARVEAAKREKSVRITKADENGLRVIIARVEAGDAVWIEAMLNHVADVLQARDTTQDAQDTQGARVSRQEFRARALGWLARPAELLALLLEHANPPADQTDHPDEPGEPGESGESGVAGGTGEPDDPEEGPVASRALAVPAKTLELLASTDLSRLRPRTTLYVHLHEAALSGFAPGVARVQGQGPLLLSQLQELLGTTRVTVKPVIDLAESTSVNAYEFPEAIKERVMLRTTGDVFPHANGKGQRLEFDHPATFDRDGPPGQTGDHNSGPLNRHDHRAKTFLAYTCVQIALGVYVWRTPHGLYRLVDAQGTHVIEAGLYAALTYVPDPDEIARAEARHLEDLRQGPPRDDEDHREDWDDQAA